jgi:hypothetical protein
LTPAGLFAGISVLHGKIGQKDEPAAERPEYRVMRHEEAEKIVQVVCPRDCKSQLVQ